MITFFTILFIIIGVNAIMLFLKLNSDAKKKKPSVDTAAASASTIYPLDSISSEYKKAV